MKSVFEEHLSSKLSELNSALSALEVPGLILSAGSEEFYFDDNRAVPFRASHYFRYFCPAGGHGHVLILAKDAKPLLLAYEPDDHWHFVEQISNTDYWPAAYDIKYFKTEDDIKAYVAKNCESFAFHGPSAPNWPLSSLVQASPALMSRLQWMRLHKSEYELIQLEAATQLASLGHKAALRSFQEGRNELEIYQAYLNAVQMVEKDLPYSAIICLDENSATLHYYKKDRNKAGGSVFLIDAGTQIKGYASDITRTYATEKAHPVFRSILNALNASQQKLCSMVKPGASMIELGYQTHVEIAEILSTHRVMHGISTEAAIEAGLTRDFFPHGLGHLLGLRLHDVGAHQINRQGELADVDPRFPYIRSRGILREGYYHTIEPGLYFNPILLNKRRADAFASHIDWKLVDELLPCGGIRIEDNLVVTKDGYKNITRKYLP
jgi:Xaa-Pro dipeptidase